MRTGLGGGNLYTHGMGIVAPTLTTLSEFESLPDADGKHEVDAGELVTLPPAKSLHSRIVRLVSKGLESYLPDDDFELFVEAGYLLCTRPLTFRQPDISVISKRRVIAANAEFYFEGAPELAVEVISPSDTAADIETKVRQYLAFGANEVWVLYSKTRNGSCLPRRF